ncbi:SUMF1/EgtB/PvdO family nonheme iron enzyme [Aestuariibacter halophilus]|uniref:SUMF1/EgtB/PvdO family nonheme iron enzyme n=1 Tax=Fluctibacter halophilus TaxID=226011 RepID=A0ABS8GAV6_9ALTE|nr:formylglycine-generating enzyme family protein [Aestuariibacter halophilus]MCC2617648.1 SUMF1/EgtB/PvdO family nonheme iron enzyme [Aestuariibacter halophilus]
MNRLAHLALAVAVSLSAPAALAADLSVPEIEQQIAQKQSEYANYNDNLAAETAAAGTLESELEELRENASLAEVDRQTALIEMNLQYEKMVEDPSLDITLVQKNYQNAVREHKLIKDAITDKYNAWQAKLREVEQLQVSKHSLLNTLEGLKELLNTARVDRLYREFNQKESVSVAHNIACDRDETLNKCMERGKNLAKQKASKRFLDAIYESLSESVEAERRRASSDGYVQVLRSEVVDSNFSGMGNFNVQLNVQLQGNLKRNEGCHLLGLDERYCVLDSDSAVADTDPVAVPAAVSTDESVMHELIVRSNVFDDEVFIDGVSYGSTRLQIMLPAGEHDVEVVKRGYEPYRQSVMLKENQTLRVELERAKYTFAKGERIQDILAGDLPGPNLVVIPAGNFRMGDISGVGLDNERPVTTQELSYSYGVSENEITVGQFQAFVEATSYVTEAEQDKGCAYYDNGKAVFEAQRNWRAPGYMQSENHPVVCISVNDAQAYADWLSEASGHTYRLPSEVEWEYAARAGKETDYWWGEGVGTDNANCGWCGSDWSNVSAAPVASFERNGFGLYDTVGNVWEWTNSNRVQSGSVVRGGAWNFAPRLARVSTRMELDASFRSNYIGFRVVREQ